jgi:ribulose bisphosphate carboxylase small subunit
MKDLRELRRGEMIEKLERGRARGKEEAVRMIAIDEEGVVRGKVVEEEENVRPTCHLYGSVP